VYVFGSKADILIPGERICLSGEPFAASAVNIPGVTGSFRLLDSDALPVTGLIDHGNNSATIDPAVLTIDGYTIEFQYDNGTPQFLTKEFSVESALQPLILNLDETAYCQNTVPFVLRSDLENVLFEGPGVNGTINSGYTFSPLEIPPGSIEISCTYISDIGCTATTRKSVDILAAPEVRFALSTACAPEGGEFATFDNLTPDTSIVESWSWNFGDPASGADNQSNLMNPSHYYENPGQVTIGLTATTVDGCIVTHELETIISSQPFADFTWISDCYTREAEVKFINKSSSGTASLDTILWKFMTKDETILGMISSDATSDTVSYVFAAADSFLVDLYTVSEGGCSNRNRKEIILRPTIQLGSEGYLEDFNHTMGMWSIHSEDQVESWVWGNPDFNGYPQVPGDNAWYTDLPAGSNGYQENSWIQSPCYDFSGMDRPMIKLDLMKSFVPDLSGAVLQYRDVLDEGWKTVGESSPGVEWYNMENIVHQPGGSRTGWGLEEFIPDSEWISAMHDLDQVAGRTSVTFRLAIATVGEQYMGNQGFAFDNVAITSRTKLAVLEHFTNSSIDTSLWADSIIDSVKTKHPGDVIDLQYHVDFEAGDPMNMFNPGPPSTRSFYYGVPRVPYTVLGGASRLHHRYDYSDLRTGIMEDHLRLLTLENPTFDIDLSLNWQETGVHVAVNVTCLMDSFDEHLQLYLVVVENEVTAYTGRNGDTNFRSVVLDMLPTAAGILLPGNWQYGTSDVQTVFWSFAPYVEDIEDLAVVAFVQDRATFEIIQAAVEYKDLSLGRSEPISDHGALLIYPNPAQQLIHVNLVHTTENSGKIELFDIQGRVVHKETVPPGNTEVQLDVSHLDKGLYLLRWSETGRINGMGKFVINR
jgi:PKD repeat protein